MSNSTIFRVLFFLLFVVQLQAQIETIRVTGSLRSKSYVNALEQEYLYVLIEEPSAQALKSSNGEEIQEMYDDHNEAMKLVLDEHWKFCKVKYITYEEAKALSKDKIKNCLFLFALTRYYQDYNEKNEVITSSLNLEPWMKATSKKGKAILGSYEQSFLFLPGEAFSVAVKGEEFERNTFYFHVDLIPNISTICINVRSMNRHLFHLKNLVKSKPIAEEVNYKRTDYDTRHIIFNENLFIDKAKLEEIQADYQFKIVTKTQEEIDKILFEGSKEYYLFEAFHSMAPMVDAKQIPTGSLIDTETGSPVTPLGIVAWWKSKGSFKIDRDSLLLFKLTMKAIVKHTLKKK